MMPLHSGLKLGHEYYVVEITTQPSNLNEWMADNFGPNGQRWFIHQNKIYFREHKDYIWFELKT